MARNPKLYTRTVTGSPPVVAAELRDQLSLADTSQDGFLTAVLAAVVEFGEKYTNKDFRANTYQMLADCFFDRADGNEPSLPYYAREDRSRMALEIRRAPVRSVSTVEYLRDGNWVAVPNTVWYTKIGTQVAEVLLRPGQDWPTDGDELEQSVRVTFTTQAVECIDMIKVAILQQAAYLYENRGDCGDASTMAESITGSGAALIYNMIRTARV